MDFDVHFSGLCRICATKGRDLASIFHTKHEDRTIADLLSIFLQTNVHEDDGRPTNICFDCIPKLLESFELLTMLNDSEQFFQQIISSKINNSQIEVSDQCAEPLVRVVKTEFPSNVDDPLAGDEVKHEEMVTTISNIKVELNRDNLSNEVKKRPSRAAKNKVARKKIEKSFECDVCGELYRSKHNLDHHLCQGQQITCEYCPEICQSTAGIQQHVQIHGDSLFSFKCGRCEQTFNMETLFIWHNMKHERTQFTCEICSKHFKLRNTWSNHIRIVHSDKRPHVCEICEKGFKDRSALEKHNRLHNGELPYSCIQCQERFRWKGGLDSHMKSHCEDPSTLREHQGMLVTEVYSEQTLPIGILPEEMCEVKIEATTCHEMELAPVRTLENESIVTNPEPVKENTAKKCVRKETARQPTKKKRNLRTYECYICRQTLSTLNRLKRHLARHKEEKPFKCSVCGEQFSSESGHDQHLCRGNEIACEYCPVVCHTTNEILQHLKVHQDDSDILIYKCARCGTIFNMKTLRAWHDMQHDRFIYACKVCGKRFGTKQSRTNHTRFVHSEERPHLCATCGKGFKNKCTLKKHEVIHSDVRPFVCPDCPKRFQLLGPLKTHMAVHRAAKHVCLICGVIKKSAATLRNHEVKHQERKKECEICGYKFFTNDGLNKHMRTHTGEKPFKCEHCPVAYAQKNDLVKHLRKHVGENTYNCDNCSMSFRYHADMRKHSFKCIKIPTAADDINVPSTSKSDSVVLRKRTK